MWWYSGQRPLVLRQVQQRQVCHWGWKGMLNDCDGGRTVYKPRAVVIQCTVYSSYSYMNRQINEISAGLENRLLSFFLHGA